MRGETNHQKLVLAGVALFPTCSPVVLLFQAVARSIASSHPHIVCQATVAPRQLSGSVRSFPFRTDWLCQQQSGLQHKLRLALSLSVERVVLLFSPARSADLLSQTSASKR
jgi:hypothetical protein